MQCFHKLEIRLLVSSRVAVYYTVIKHAQNNKTRFFYGLYSDKTWVFDVSERAQGPIYIIFN